MKQKLAKIFAWGQLVIVYLNEALAHNGGVIPSTKDDWLKLLGSAALAYSIHNASQTSANHPNGAATKPSEMLDGAK